LRGEEQGSKSPFSLLSEPISPSSLNVYLTFSPSSLLFPPISPSSQLFLGHFSLLPILFLPPLLTSEIFTRYPSSNFFAFMLQAAPICRESTSPFPLSEVVSLHRFQLADCKFNYSVFSQLIRYHLFASSTFCFPLSLICFRIAMKLNCECDVVILQIAVPR